MKLATSTGDYSRYFDDHEERIRHVATAGFKYIDFSFYTEAKANSVFFREDWRDYAKRLRSLADELGVTFVQAHSPGGNPLVKDGNYQILVDSTIRSIEVCEILGVPCTVSHAGWDGKMDFEVYCQRNLDFYKQMYPVMEKTGVMLLTENSTHANMGDQTYFYKGSEMRDFIKYANHPLMGNCWDTGHANIEGNQYDDIVAMGDTLTAVHINDNRGERDEHVMMYCGTVNMDEVMHALIDVGFKGPFTLECDSTIRPAMYWLGWRRGFDKDTRLANAPIEIMQKAEELLYMTGKHILSAYDLFED